MDNITIFNDTRQLSNSLYKADTENAKSLTSVIKSLSVTCSSHDMQIEFEELGTITSVLRHKEEGRVAILNFADALEPGGLVLYGANTQEECICRCSNLYECLIQEHCKQDYYNYNQSFGYVYSDRLIYSQGVRIIKDEDYNVLDYPCYVDVITSPSPSCGVQASVFLKRMNLFIQTAAFHNVDVLILGAWGCGAFGQDASVVGKCFAKVLSRNKYFSKVVFAVRPTANIADSNFNKLKNGFNEKWGNDYEVE